MSTQPGPRLRSNVRRFSFLKRNPRHSRSFFSEYYASHHGPLAAAQAGFRKYTTRYVQNHILDLPDGSEPRFDGLSVTTQVPRADYTHGFFNEPDYENVKADENYLFDMSATVSLLGEEVQVVEGSPSAFKLLLLAPWRDVEYSRYTGLVRAVVNRLALDTASALGFRRSHFTDELLAELWFDSEPSRAHALAGACAAKSQSEGTSLLPAREVLIFGPEKPWRA
jgi:hypothetical protein